MNNQNTQLILNMKTMMLKEMVMMMKIILPLFPTHLPGHFFCSSFE